MWRSFTPLNSSLSLSLTWHLISSSQLCLFIFSSYLLTWQSFPHTETIEHTWRHRTTLGNTNKVFGKMSSTRAVHFLSQCLLALALHYCDFYSATATPIDSLLGTHRVKGSVLPQHVCLGCHHFQWLPHGPSTSPLRPWFMEVLICTFFVFSPALNTAECKLETHWKYLLK